jgi:hypothetical protein
MVKGKPAKRLGRRPGRAAVLTTNPEMWSRCGCVIRYVSTSDRVIYAALALADSCGISRPAKGPSHKMVGNFAFTSPVGVLDDLCVSRISVMAAKWTPASTASKQPFFQPAAVDLARNAVTLSSFGPPPEP